jgi:hypothetical protein
VAGDDIGVGGRDGADQRRAVVLGKPRWRLELLRCHGGGRPGAWAVVWRGTAPRG